MRPRPSGFRRTAHRTALAALTAGVLLGGSGLSVAAGASSGAQAPAATSSPRSQLRDSRPCEGAAGFTCSTLRVPLDHSGRVPGSLDLAIAAADNVAAPRGVLLVLTGGPGQPGVSLVERIKRYFDPAVLTAYRMVVLDQRGTGPKGINCVDLQAAVGSADFSTPPTDAAVSCGVQLGMSRSFHRTADTVQDLDDLRRALGVRSWTLDGTSYGTFVATHYGLTYPGRVRRLVLDSVVPQGGFDPFATDQMAATRRVLAQTCAANPGCTTDPVADLAWVVRHARIDGRPVNGTHLLDALAIMSISTINPTFQGVPEVFAAARAGDTAPLKGFLAALSGAGTPYDQLSSGLHLATWCSDLRFPWGTSATPVGQRQRSLDRAIARLDPVDLHPYDVATARQTLPIAGCRDWPVAQPNSTPKLQRLVARTLIVHGRNDLFCPVEWVAEQKRTAPRATTVIVEGEGHGVQGSPNPAGRDAVRDFLL